MKKISLIIALVATGWHVQAQKIEQQNLPVAVLQNFTKLYPDVVNVKWELEDGNYEGQYKKNDIQSEVVFSSTGTFIQAEKSLNSPHDLPAAVLASLKKDFSGFNYKDAEIVTIADGQTLYEVEALKAAISYELIYEANGTLKEKSESHPSTKEKDKKKK